MAGGASVPKLVAGGFRWRVELKDKLELGLIKNNLLYYPYIDLPENTWLTRMLLYYDQIGTITPLLYKRYPNKFTPFTLDLIKENLVVQVFPSEYVHGIEGFAESFEEYMESLGDELASRRRSFRKQEDPFHTNRAKVHISKMEPLCDYLVKNKLAQKADNQWYDVENSTALDFMSYLAAMIGQVDEAGFTPVTDEAFPLNRLVESISDDARMENTTGEIRTQLLENLFPAPVQSIKPIDILYFKQKHGDKLSAFRYYIEKSIIDILNTTDEGLRRRRIALFKQKTGEDIEEITNAMQEHGWAITALTSFYALISEIPVIGVPMKIAREVHNAATGVYSPSIKIVKETPLLYAAVAQKELLSKTTRTKHSQSE